MGQRKGKRANLRDVARAANVSVATVSRVLNTPDAVQKDTRQKVQRAIDRLHFVPSAAARAINSGRSRIVGALVPTLDNAIFARFLAAIETRLNDHNLSLVVATTGGDPDREASKAQSLVNIGAEGLIVSGVTHGPEFDRLVDRTRLPVIATSFYDPDYRLPTIGYDNRLAARTAVEHLISLGHRDIALVFGPLQNNDRTRARLDGAMALSVSARLQPYECAISTEGGRDAARRFLKGGTRATAIVCFSDVLAVGVLFELQHHGLSVPKDFSLVGIDDLPIAPHTVPPLTTVHLPVGKMGETAAEAIANWIEHQTAPGSQLIEAVLVPRKSTAPQSDRRDKKNA